jgi:tetratricopeptide (TPR) repeat protein
MADSLCDTNPDSALSLLSSIGKDSMQMTEADLMYWRLLCIKAADKAYIPFTTDSAAVAVMHYYENGGDQSLLPTAYYYAGRASADIGDAPQALDYYQKALDVIEYNKYKRLDGILYAQMGYLYRNQELYSFAMEAHRKCLEWSIRNADKFSACHACGDIATIYMKIDSIDLAMIYEKKSLEYANELEDERLINSRKVQLARCLGLAERYDEALELLRTVPDNLNNTNLSAKHCIKAIIFAKTNQLDSAYKEFMWVKHRGTIYAKQDCYGWLSDYYNSKNISDSSIIYAARYKDLTDSINQTNAVEQVARMNAMYNYQLREKENLHLKNVTQAQSYLIIIITLITISVIGFSIVLFLYSRQRKKKYELKIEKYQNIINDYKNNQEKEILKIKTINDYDIVKYIHNTLINPDGPNRMSNKHWEQLSDAVNEVYPNFNSRLNDLCRMNQFTTRICHLIKIGVSPKDMAILTNHSTSAITSVRKRLYEKAFNKKGTPSDWDEIVRAID